MNENFFFIYSLYFVLCSILLNGSFVFCRREICNFASEEVCHQASSNITFPPSPYLFQGGYILLIWYDFFLLVSFPKLYYIVLGVDQVGQEFFWGKENSWINKFKIKSCLLMVKLMKNDWMVAKEMVDSIMVF